MNRRQTIASLVGAGTVLTAGCLSLLSDDDDDRWTPTIPDDPDQYPISDYDQLELFPDVEITDELVFHDPSDGSGVWAVNAWNKAGVPQFEVGVVDIDNHRIIHHDAYEIPPELGVRFVFRRKSTYVIYIYLPQSEFEYGVRGGIPAIGTLETLIGILDEDRIEARTIGS